MEGIGGRGRWEIWVCGCWYLRTGTGIGVLFRAALNNRNCLRVRVMVSHPTARPYATMKELRFYIVQNCI